MTPEEMRDKAVELFVRRMGIRDDAVIKAMGAYGGGIAGSGNVCGILLGAVAMISSIHSRASLEEKEDPRMWSMSRKFISEFEKLAQSSGGINCRDIAGVDWQDREAVKAFYSDPESSRRECIRLVGEASLVLGRLLEEEGQGERS
jgi:C_GCAxxG_C_C family probable redox protein